MKKIIFVVCLLISSTNILSQVRIDSLSYVLTPFYYTGLDEISVKTSESILRMELEKLGIKNLISEQRTEAVIGNEICNNTDCAVAVAEKLNADRVIFCKLNPLGEKIIVQYYLIDVKSKVNLLIEQTTATSIEDLENVMKRIAKSISSVRTFSESAEVGRITETETLESLRRSSKYNFGITFGYLFPQTGYDNELDKTFTFNTHFDYELPDYSIGLMFGLRKGFAANIYGHYLFSKTDFCPYLGGSFGFHWVTHKAEILFSNEKKSSDGFELGFATD
ncbi:Hypothetical protein IALB_0016 [Ignavibacterium album JCM 16511]|uniref:TolB N-terminal domain-containing protein n=1 Tax=Ignavibacterium album (strain DSM 19864 / JCM 16511 / NBRC 101810 / Mat9-16) TaxID=945713 RepID=I0AFH3_IGNAJ|nr:hypothetical protein [Ignavibacterium album]AFH47730.1 Hypothetical protein IALB_0016 [Ignavibacterium album JCM 16511]